ncbi:MAG: hypothetical protein IKY23_10390 [Lachnospiraceae bacterium]|nr:hypothetical protein [Lachnospiraceae bacterium]
MSREEKLQLNRDRQKAVRDAWSREKELVSKGKGTVDWSIEQQKEIMETGRVKGYEGQHMKSVNEYPEYAGSSDNIQFLTHEEHLEAHNSGEEKAGYHSPTNGYYDVSSKTMYSFGDNPPKAPETLELSNPCYRCESNFIRYDKGCSYEESNSVKRSHGSNIVVNLRGRG